MFPKELLWAKDNLKDGSLSKKVGIALSWAESQPGGAHWAFVLEHVQVCDGQAKSNNFFKVIVHVSCLL